MWDQVGMSRNAGQLENAIRMIREVKEGFWKDVRITGEENNLNPELEKALRVADFLEMAELIALDASERKESCGGHFREEHVTEEGEAQRDDINFSCVMCWEYKGASEKPLLHKEDLAFESVVLSQRSYK